MSTDIVAAKAADADELIDVKRVSQLTSLATRTVWRYRDAGFIPPPVKVGAAVRWRARDIFRWIEEGCRPVRHVSKGGAK